MNLNGWSEAVGENWTAFLSPLPLRSQWGFSLGGSHCYNNTCQSTRLSQIPLKVYLDCSRTPKLKKWHSIAWLTLLNLFFKLYSRRSGIWNRCWDRLEGWRLSVNGPELSVVDQPGEGGEGRKMDSFKYESDMQLMSREKRRISWMSKASRGVSRGDRKHWVLGLI